MGGCSLRSPFLNFVSDFYYFNALFWEIGKGKREGLHLEYMPKYSRGEDLPIANWHSSSRERYSCSYIYLHADSAKLPADVLAGGVCHGQPTMQILRRIPGLGRAMVTRFGCPPYHLAQCGKCGWLTTCGNMVNKRDKIIWIWWTTLYTAWMLNMVLRSQGFISAGPVMGENSCIAVCSGRIAASHHAN